MRRKGLCLAGSLVVLIIISLLILPLVVNANSFRPRIEAELRSSLGRNVEIGDLGFSLFSGGIAARDITVADDPNFSRTPFLRAKSLTLGVQLWPLVTSRSLRVTGLTLNQPELTLLRGPSGKWNFSSLGTGQKGAAAPPAAAQRDFSVEKLRVVNGRVSIGNSAQPNKRSTYDNVNLTASGVSYTAKIPFTLQATTPGGGAIQLEGTAGPIDRSDAALTPLSARINVKKMDVASAGLVDPASGLAGTLDFTGTVDSNGRIAHTAGTANVDKLRLVRAGAPARQPVTVEYASEYDLKREAGVLSKGEIRTGSSTARLSGTYDTRGDSTTVHMKLSGSQLPVSDIEGLLPAVGVALPAGSRLQGGTVDANLALDGPVDRLVTAGSLNISNTKLAGFNLASKLAGLSALSGVPPQAETIIQTLSSNLRISPEGIRADNLSIIVPALGSMTGSGTISANNALNFRMLARLSNPTSVVGQLTSRIPGLGRGSSGTIPFRVQGTTAEPVFLPDVGGMVAGGLSNPLQPQTQPSKQQQPGIGDVLTGIFGKKK